MFTQFPKTSQCSITNMDNKYIISGGVDGYVYIWNDKYECIKVVRCFDQEQEITAVAYCKNHRTLIIGSIQGRIKCFAFDIKTKVRKPNAVLSDEIKA
jgi:WD40 repeat protein